jgi:glycerophosphoryl diester phosphodiesterase
MNYWKLSKKNIFVAAHRGWSTDYPENTMLAFKKAAEIGVDQIETDVRVTLDGELVLIHDSTVDRTTNGKGKVCEKTLAELKTLDAGCRKGEQFKGERIPTFIEFMDYVKTLPKMTLDIELKEYPDNGREEIAYSVCDRVLKIIDEYGFTDRVVINSWSGKLNEYISEKYGKKYRQHVYYPSNCMGKMTKNPYEYAYCSCMFTDTWDVYNTADKDICDKMTAIGVSPWAGASIKDEGGVDRAIDVGAELITCNNPDVILTLLKKKGYHD